MNIENRTLYIADNLDILRGIDSESVDLIYLDPPFNTNKRYKAPVGSKAEGAEFKDIWMDEEVKDEWYGAIAEGNEELYQIINAIGVTHSKSMMCYTMAMAIRLFEMHRVLKSTGSIYLHCDDTASHYLKLVMDALFGRRNFRNEVIWKRTTSAHKGGGKFGRIHDVILFYTKSTNSTWNTYYRDYTESYLKHFKHEDSHGKYRTHSLIYSTSDLPKTGETIEPWGGFDIQKYGVWCVPRRSVYAEYIEKHFVPGYTQIAGVHARLDALAAADLIHWTTGGRPEIKRYLAASPGSPPQDILTDIHSLSGRNKEKTGYPTQKPLALLHRIIEASSNPGDMVLDPFCGCATACVAAEQLGRRWVGIDESDSAEFITKLRLQEYADEAREDPNSPDWFNALEDIVVSTDAPVRTDVDPASKPKRARYQDHKQELFGMQRGICNGCQHQFFYRNLTVDHIRATAGGEPDDSLGNLQLLCGACNSMKGTGTQEALIEKLKKLHIL